MLDQIVADARQLLASANVAALGPAAARNLTAQCVELERIAGSLKVLAAKQMLDTDAGPGDASFRDTESWLAAQQGSSVGAARAVTGLAARLDAQPEILESVRAGALSTEQTALVSDAASADPNAVRGLLDVAETAGLKGLKDQCARVIRAAESLQEERELLARIQDERSLRHRRLGNGAGEIVMRGPLDETALFMAALGPEEERIFREHRASGRRDSPEQIAYDAAIRLARAAARITDTAGRREGKPVAVLNIVVDHDAYVRGHTEPGELCEITGVGPIPVSTARRYSSDAIINGIVTKGVEITHIAHLGRAVPAALRTAFNVEFDQCSIEGCEVTRHLEWDHNIPHAEGGLTSYENIGPLCSHDHRRKTVGDLRRIGPRGRQRLVTKTEYERLRAGEELRDTG